MTIPTGSFDYQYATHLTIESQLESAKREIARLEDRAENDKLLLTQLVVDRDFLLPHATTAILERQLCLENPGLNDLKESFQAVVKLTQPDFDFIVNTMVERRIIDLLRKLMENK